MLQQHIVLCSSLRLRTLILLLQLMPDALLQRQFPVLHALAQALEQEFYSSGVSIGSWMRGKQGHKQQQRTHVMKLTFCIQFTLESCAAMAWNEGWQWEGEGRRLLLQLSLLLDRCKCADSSTVADAG